MYVGQCVPNFIRIDRVFFEDMTETFRCVFLFTAVYLCFLHVLNAVAINETGIVRREK